MDPVSLLDPNRLYPSDPATRALARSIHASISDLPIISPHGHVDPQWFAENEPFSNATELFVIPDHYVLRMLVSQGVSPDALGVARRDGSVSQTDRRESWRLFAAHYHLFRATPSRLWLDHVFETLFGIHETLSADNADAIYDAINVQLAQPEFRPRALFDRFNIEVLATTESPLDDLFHHAMIASSGWGGRVITTYRPDPVMDPDHENFAENLDRLGALTKLDLSSFDNYLDAHRARRAYFRSFGATATDHGHPTARTLALSHPDASALYQKVRGGAGTVEEAETFRAHMLVEMARMSVEDGMVMQLHPGSYRNHSATIFKSHGRDMGFDIPRRTDYVEALKPLLDEVGLRNDFTLILFTLDETTLSRELAPLAGVYPALKLGPAWWFFDSAEGMRRYREIVTETAGFYNTAGFNDDTRAFCSIPARHDVARRVDSAFLADLVVTGRLGEEDAFALAEDLTVNLARKAYRL